MSLQDISHILSSRERLDLIEGHHTEQEDIGSATESNRHSVHGPDGKLYQPLSQNASPTEKTEPQTEHPTDSYERGLCGLGLCKPKWCQRLANLNVFVVVYGVAGIWMITLSTFLGSQVTSIERHLGMSSSKTGFILSSNEIGYLVVVILGSHLGKYTHIPVFLSISGLIFGLATLAMAFGRLETPRVWQDDTGVSLTAMVLGPPIALFLGSFASSLPVDLKETTMSKFDHRWVGAWWLGFMIIGLACIVSNVPVMFFPKHMRKVKTPNVPEATSSTSLRVMMLDLPKSLGRCFRRPIYVLALLFNCIEGFAFAGSFAFYQKYMETQFNKTAQQISTITGVLTLFTIVLGTFFGGFFTTKLKLGLRGCAVITLVTAAVTGLLDCLNLVFGCQNSDIVGTVANSTLSAEACGCSEDIFIVCGDNKVNYLSPCLAGCRNATADMMFTNCTSINNGQARPGMCDLDCDFFIPYLVVFCFGYFLGTLSIIPGFMLSVRSVEQQDQSLATGTASFCQTLIGILPSPICFGKLIDMSCALWSSSGNCMLYDRERFRHLYYGVYLGLRFASLGVMAALLWLSHRDVLRERANQKSTATVEK
ncbi:hypothetical protein BsWGS_14758 [Bradybaena similaris]